jgi:hypothetical protein
MRSVRVARFLLAVGLTACSYQLQGRVEMEEGDFGPEKWQELLPAVDRLRGL